MIKEPEKAIRFKCVLGHREGDIIIAERPNRWTVRFKAGYKDGVSSKNLANHTRRLVDLGDRLQFTFDWSVWQAVKENTSESPKKPYLVTFEAIGYIDIHVQANSEEEAYSKAKEIIDGKGSIDLSDLQCNRFNVYKEEQV